MKKVLKNLRQKMNKEMKFSGSTLIETGAPEGGKKGARGGILFLIFYFFGVETFG